jgi:Fe-S-cluster containining protein
VTTPSSFHLKITYTRAGEALDKEAAARGFPCASGCSTCCNVPVLLNNADVIVLRDGVRRLSPENFAALKVRADAYLASNSAQSQALSRREPLLWLAVAEKAWPKEGAPCPALEPADETGRRKCAVYDRRPLACRMHASRDRETGGPCVMGSECETLDTRPAQQTIVTENRLKLAGILGIELAEIVAGVLE